MFKRVIDFINIDVWNYNVASLPKIEALSIKTLRVILIAAKDFVKDQCVLRASALTYYTMLTVVPVLALAFGIAKGFGLEKILQQQLFVSLKGQEEVVEQLIQFINNLLQKTRGEVVAGIGIMVLLWSVMRILHNIEATLNEIWQVKRARTLMRKLTDYIALTILAPILIALSSSMTVYITTTVKRLTDEVGFLENAGPLINSPLKLLPYAIIWLLLTFLYMVIPNKKVKFKSAFIGGIIAGTAYNVVQWGYITFQIGASNFNAIYGSFAALPLFLIWLQLSWSIVLFGAEISFAVQNVHRFERPTDISHLSQYKKRLLSLVIAHLIVNRFKEDKPPISVSEISDELRMPEDLTGELIMGLEGARIISGTVIDEKRKELGYQPARDINQLTIHKVVSLLETDGINNINLEDSAINHQLKTALSSFNEAMKKEGTNVLLIDVK